MLPSLSNLALHTSKMRTGVGTGQGGGLDGGEGGGSKNPEFQSELAQRLKDVKAKLDEKSRVRRPVSRKSIAEAVEEQRKRLEAMEATEAATPASDDEAESTRVTETDDTVGTDETKDSNASDSAHDESDDDDSSDDESRRRQNAAQLFVIATKLKTLKGEVDFINEVLDKFDESIETYVKAEVEELEQGFQEDLIEASNRLDAFVSELTTDIKTLFEMYKKTDTVVEGNRQRITTLETRVVQPANGITLSAEKRAELVRANQMLKELLREIRGEQTSS